MSYEKMVKDLMIPLEDYPHVPYWFTLVPLRSPCPV